MIAASGRLDLPFTCVDSTGAPTAPTGTPTGVLVKNGTDLGTTVTVTMSTAQGIASCTIPSNAVDGDRFYIRVSAVISSVTYTLSGPAETVINSVSQTGDSFARIGTNGAGLTAIGDTRMANLDAAVSTRATPTNITQATGVVLASATHTGAVIPTVTNLTNAPTNGDLTSTMKASVTTAATAATPIAASVANYGTLVADVAAAVWSAVTRTLTAFSFTVTPSNASSTAAALAAIDAKTSNLPSDPADQSLVEAAIASATSPLATASALASVASVTDKLDTALIIDGSVYQFTSNALENAPTGGGGSSSVIVYPLNASMPLKSVGLLMTFYTEESGVVMGPIGVTARSGNTIIPVDLSGRTLEVRFIDYLGTELLSIPDGDITISGTDNDQFEFVVTTDLTSTPTVCHEDQYHHWTLRDISNGDNVLLAGRARVLLS